MSHRKQDPSPRERPLRWIVRWGIWTLALWSLCDLLFASSVGRAAPASTIRLVIDGEPAHLNPLLEPDLWGHRIAHDLVCEPL
ncbi:MAG TPA: hypothetical protein PKW11_17530, partial [Pseudomonadota bacterium]|nr:hypothetical protein [Pseudomonadota bacterium]